MVHSDMMAKDDLEKQGSSEDERPAPRSYGLDEQTRRGSVTSYHEGFFSGFTLESFKRNPNARVVTEATDSEGRPLPDQPPAEPALAMKLKERHLQMIAIGGSIGTFNLFGAHVVVETDNSARYWSIRWCWIRTCARWTGFAHYRIWPDRNHVVLHSSCSWRVGSGFSRSRSVFRLLESFHW
jgi:hypothetical protein